MTGMITNPRDNTQTLRTGHFPAILNETYNTRQTNTKYRNGTISHRHLINQHISLLRRGTAELYIIVSTGAGLVPQRVLQERLFTVQSAQSSSRLCRRSRRLGWYAGECHTVHSSTPRSSFAVSRVKEGWVMSIQSSTDLSRGVRCGRRSFCFRKHDCFERNKQTNKMVLAFPVIARGKTLKG